MRRIMLLLLAVLLLTGMFAGCGANSGDTAAAGGGQSASAGENYTGEASPEEAPAEDRESSGSVGVANSTSSIECDKIIYTGYAEVETLDFDASIDALYTLVERSGGFVESSSITGVDYAADFYGYGANRTARFTLRIPQENYTSTTDALGSEIGNVTYLSNEATNVSATYTDYAARLEVYETEEARLMAYLESAESVEEMLAIEDRLTEVRYQIETYTSYLQDLDNQIQYSTLDVTLTEVRALTEEPEEDLGYWATIGAGFMDSLERVGRFFQNLFLGIASNLPVILCWLIVLAAIFFVCRLLWKRHRRTVAPAPIHTAPANAKGHADTKGGEQE